MEFNRPHWSSLHAVSSIGDVMHLVNSFCYVMYHYISSSSDTIKDVTNGWCTRVIMKTNLCPREVALQPEIVMNHQHCEQVEATLQVKRQEITVRKQIFTKSSFISEILNRKRIICHINYLALKDEVFWKRQEEEKNGEHCSKDQKCTSDYYYIFYGPSSAWSLKNEFF